MGPHICRPNLTPGKDMMNAWGLRACPFKAQAHAKEIPLRGAQPALQAAFCGLSFPEDWPRFPSQLAGPPKL